MASISVSLGSWRYDVYKRLGDDLSEWQKILAELKKSRTTFDEEKERSFGLIVVNCRQGQSKVGAKYDFWQKEILKNFAGKLGDSMGQFYTDIAKAKDDLEVMQRRARSLVYRYPCPRFKC